MDTNKKKSIDDVIKDIEAALGESVVETATDRILAVPTKPNIIHPTRNIPRIELPTPDIRPYESQAVDSEIMEFKRTEYDWEVQNLPNSMSKHVHNVKYGNVPDPIALITDFVPYETKVEYVVGEFLEFVSRHITKNMFEHHDRNSVLQLGKLYMKMFILHILVGF